MDIVSKLHYQKLIAEFGSGIEEVMNPVPVILSAANNLLL